MKQRKNRYIRNHKYEKLNWNDYMKILVLCSKWKNWQYQK